MVLAATRAFTLMAGRMQAMAIALMVAWVRLAENLPFAGMLPATQMTFASEMLWLGRG